jgi:hypothetical protein
VSKEEAEIVSSLGPNSVSERASREGCNIAVRRATNHAYAMDWRARVAVQRGGPQMRGPLRFLLSNSANGKNLPHSPVPFGAELRRGRKAALLGSPPER